MSIITYKICAHNKHIGEKLLPISMFFKDNTRKDGYDKQCKSCRKSMLQKRIDKDPEAYKRANTTRQMTRYHTDEKYRQSQRVLIYRNMPAITAKRRAQKILATPTWFEEPEVRGLYLLARQISKQTGIPHDVDHIIPLINKHVCGLHCLVNLRIIPSRENGKKTNKLIEDIL